MSFFGQNPSNPWWLLNTVIWVANSLAWPCWMDVPHTTWFFQRFWHVLTHKTCQNRVDSCEQIVTMVNLKAIYLIYAQSKHSSSSHHRQDTIFILKYPLHQTWLAGKSPTNGGKSPINGPFSIAMFDYWRVICFILFPLDLLYHTIFTCWFIAHQS